MNNIIYIKPKRPPAIEGIKKLAKSDWRKEKIYDWNNILLAEEQATLRQYHAFLIAQDTILTKHAKSPGNVRIAITEAL